MLNKGINISIENSTAEQFENFRAFDWYHFAKFSERLLSSNDEKYFDIAKRAVEISRQEFLNYKNKIGDVIEHPAYITFSKMAICFDILADNELALDLHETALQGVEADGGDDAAAFQLVMLANYLLTLQKNNAVAKFDAVANKIKNFLDEYFKSVNVDSMKELFEKIKDVAQISRAILL